MFRRFMIVCWVLFAVSTVTSFLSYVGYKSYEKKTDKLYEMGLNPFDRFDSYDGNPFIDLIPEDGLLLMIQKGEQQDRRRTRNDDLPVEGEQSVDQNNAPNSDTPDGFKVVERDSTDWRNAPIVDTEEARKRNERFAAMAELDRRYSQRKENYQTAGFIGAGLAAMIFMWNLIWHTGHWVWMGRDSE